MACTRKAHRTWRKATPGKSLSVSYSELCCDFNKCPPTKPASIQFQRTPPTPSRPTTTTAICDSDNPRDGVACTYRAYRTCNKSDSWQEPFGIRLRAIVCFSKYPPSKPASIQFQRTPFMPSHRSAQGGGLFSFLFHSMYVSICARHHLERAPWPLALNIDTQDRCPLFRRMFCGHNIEFSCPAASAAPC
jgi:hypothetical protein